MTDERKILERVLDEATGFLDGLRGGSVAARTDVDGVAATLRRPLPDEGTEPLEVIEELIAGAEPGLVATPSGRFFGWVIGGALPAALAADWLTSTWDQNGVLLTSSPAAAGAEWVASEWLLDLLNLPANSAVGFVTGAMAANFSCLAAARHEVFRRAGWNVERDGLRGAPDLAVIVGEERHETVDVHCGFWGWARPGAS
jgi:glutamate/tyrosine decarboxylase-like PLP-dependent enzyme